MSISASTVSRAPLGLGIELTIGLAFIAMCALGVLTVLLPETESESAAPQTTTATDTNADAR